MSLAFLFPGQGSQRPDMLHILPSTPAVSAVLDESRSQLRGLGLTTNIDTAAALRDTTNVQIALLIAGVACASAHRGPRSDRAVRRRPFRGRLLRRCHRRRDKSGRSP